MTDADKLDSIKGEVDKPIENISDKAKLAKALSLAQAEFPVVETNKQTSYHTKKGGETFFKWADLGQLRKTINPVLAKHGLAVIQDVETARGDVVVTTTLLHESGAERQSKPLRLGCPGDDPKIVGAHITYGCRYSYTSFLNVPIDDIDIDQLGLKEEKPQNVPEPPPPRPRVMSDPITPQEQLHLFDLLAATDWSPDKLKLEMQNVFGKISSKDLTLGEYADLSDLLLARRKRIIIPFDEYDALLNGLAAKKARVFNTVEEEVVAEETVIEETAEEKEAQRQAADMRLAEDEEAIAAAQRLATAPQANDTEEYNEFGPHASQL